MLPEDAFLRRLPHIVDDEQALRSEALVFAADSVAANHEALRAIATRYGEDPERMTHRDRIRLFNSAWSVVDHVHAVRQLLRALGLDQEIEEVRNFLNRFESAKKLRDRMDHLSDNLRNIAAKKGRLPPIFGSISYVAVGRGDISASAEGPRISSATIVSVVSGPVRGKQTSPMLNPVGRNLRMPVGGFHLYAFGEQLSVDDVAEELAALLVMLNARLEKSVRSQAESFALEQGHSLDELLGHSGSGLTICVKVSFDRTALS